MSQELLNAAFAVCKDFGYPSSPERAYNELIKQYPAVDRPTLEDAITRSEALISAGCDWAEQFRGANSRGKGLPKIVLSEVCPGFSESVYSAAQSWGLFLTK